MLKISLLAACLIALAACANTPPAAPRTATSKAASSSGSPVGCVNKTASRLPPDPNDCAGFGSSHSSEEIKNTGQPFAQDALRMIDPAVTGHP